MNKVMWIEVEPANGGLISAAASVSNGYRQLLADKLLATLYVQEHFSLCHKCNRKTGTYCEDGKALFKEIGERLGGYAKFLKTMNDFRRMSDIFGGIVEDETWVTT